MAMKSVLRVAAVCGSAAVIGVAGVQVASANLASPQAPTNATIDTVRSGDGADAGERGPRGKRGKRGPRGFQGPPGQTGPMGPASFPVSGVSTGELPGADNDSGFGWRFYPAGNLDGDLLPPTITEENFGGFAVAPFAMTITNFSLTRSPATPPGNGAQADWFMVVDTDGPFSDGGRTSYRCRVLAGSDDPCSLTTLAGDPVTTVPIPNGATYWFYIPDGGGFGPGAYFSYILNRA